MARFQGKVVVVTGAGGGIGLATAQAFANEGAAVTAVDIRQDLLSDAVRAIADAGGRAIGVCADVCARGGRAPHRGRDGSGVWRHRRARQQRGYRAVRHRGGDARGPVGQGDRRQSPRRLSCVALLHPPYQPAWRWRHRPRSQRAGVRVFAAQRRICRQQGRRGSAHARDGARSRGRTYPGQLCLPGSIETPMLKFAAEQEADPAAAYQAWASKHPIGRIGQPREVAATILFLASDDASFITGSPYLVDGGLSAPAWW